ncbi:MAG: CTP synthase [Planctomycetota bacterium]|jgi:CTP synthase
MTKYIFITGGVVSSLGKGLTTASIGLILEKRGLNIRLQKLDPYINVDPGTMSPFQHGEVYVLDDGSETDLDLGHYERFTNAPLNQNCNFTTGKIYGSVIQKERHGEYLGKTVQVIPHITDEIKAAVETLADDDVDVVLTEIGGTVGDIESLPFLEAIRQFRLDKGRDNVLYIHLTLLPFLRASQETKTKPTQQSVGKLREIGIQPDILICRTERAMTKEERDKISLFCNVEPKAVIEERDVEHTIYEVPLVLQREGLPDLLEKNLNLPASRIDLSDWEQIINRIRDPEHEVNVAVVGKYIHLHDAYKSIYEALTHAGVANNARVNVRKVISEDIEEKGVEALLEDVHAVLVPGGFGERGVEGKVAAVQYAREKKIPYLGICYGLHMAIIDLARNVCGLEGANSTEIDPKTPHPVICLLEEQKKVRDMGGTMRLGVYPCKLQGGKAREAYGEELVHERHRHRYEVNDDYLDQLVKAGAIPTGINEKLNLVEILELKDHPWFVAVQFHPEFKSKPTRAHPLFDHFIRAAVQLAGG